MDRITANFDKSYGKIKCFNAVNNAPMSARGFDNKKEWADARIPYSRLHDTALYEGYGGEWVVDVHRIFRDFDADENDAKNYIFAPTDRIIERIISSGTEPYFRLGASIEHAYKYGTYPPKDYLKWARICEHIIRHYTEGWADGFNHKITYWEIWNEADNNNPTGNPCWQGTADEFCEFFIVSCRYLQSKFPSLKIGGPAIATFWHTEWCENFFDKLRASGVRPDFISYHRYNKTVEDFVEYVRMANEMLERYGFGDVETHLNEWNYIRGWRGEEFKHSCKSMKGLKGASFTAAVMCALHPEKLDMLMYYDAAVCLFGGMFDYVYEPLKGYYPFLAFSQLVDLGTAVEGSSDPYLYSLGATDGRDAAILCTYFNQDDGIEGKTARLEVRGIELAEGEMLNVKYLLLDEEHDLECVRAERFTSGNFDLILDMPPYTTYLIKIERE